MHGYGYPPEQPPKHRPSSGMLNALRVLFVTLTVLSCGLLAWGSMLRLAIVTRARRDWALLILVFVLNVGLFAFIMATPDDPDKMTDTQALIGAAWLFGVMIGSIAYYLYADIRHFGPYGPYGGGLRAPRAQYSGYLPPQAPPVTPAAPTPGYGYPSATPQAPASRPPIPQPPMPRPPIAQPPMPRPPMPQPPVPQQSMPAATPAPPTAPTPPPVSPAPHPRLDQVRAELDELSEYLRKEGGNR